jgi:hypothetical protein
MIVHSRFRRPLKTKNTEIKTGRQQQEQGRRQKDAPAREQKLILLPVRPYALARCALPY